MPACLIEDQDGMGARRDVECDLFEVHPPIFVLWASLLQRGMTTAAPLPSAGQIAPKM